MPDIRRVHRFRDHAIAGINWRPTRFVDELHSSRVCGLCRMIPKTTVLLPCSHVLCPSCHAANSRECGGRCPLDQEPFDEAECCALDFPVRKANALKVHCWNEANGCQFVGAIEDMLEHNGNECDYHAVECLRCGQEVLHRELSSHYLTGCNDGTSSGRAGNTSLESTALTLQDVRNALEEVKALLTDADHDQALLAIEIKVNDIAEQLGNKEATSTATTRGVGPSAGNANAGATQVASTASSTPLRESASQRNGSGESSSLSRAHNATTPRKLHFFANLPAHVLGNMRKICSQDYPRYAVTGRGPVNVKCHLSLTDWPSSSTGVGTWREALEDVVYQLAIENIHEDLLSQGESTSLSQITVSHTRDAYFKVDVIHDAHFLYVQIEFYGMLEGSPCPAPSLEVSTYDGEDNYIGLLYSFPEFCCCQHDEDSFVHFHRTFRMRLDTLKSDDCLLSGTLRFDISFEKDPEGSSVPSDSE